MKNTSRHGGSGDGRRSQSPGRRRRPLIRAVTASDAAALAGIYNHYVEHTIATFEETPVSVAQMAGRIEVGCATLPWLAAEAEGEVAGYAYAAPWKPRSGYRHTVESTIYLHPDATGAGIGSVLYGALIDAIASRDVHCVIGGIALPNAGSVALHEKLGFEQVAHFRETGRKFGRWIDVGYWELMLEHEPR